MFVILLIRTLGLCLLYTTLLKCEIQKRTHDIIDDAYAALQLFDLYKKKCVVRMEKAKSGSRNWYTNYIRMVISETIRWTQYSLSCQNRRL